ncbi:hypothetical protein CF253_16510 [Salmonella enterica]|nr:hypothetical protein [Salmonella enterica]EBS8342428.1 hypothetical protein [Salmonella enterica]EBS8685709.1 hypothetical protein [Salmonella enterica]EBT3582350.1 hypothetical protein [Salmonella enterica]EBT5380603.1 hypothetical protein [Salmonella enterica]
MDTVEELNSTYFYAGRSNLTASQLLFMIFCENTANQLGVQYFGAIKMVAKISAFTGRAIPVVGWIILASDVSQIAYRTVRDYNRIARGSDKIW